MYWFLLFVLWWCKKKKKTYTIVLVMDWIALLDYLLAKSYARSKIPICFVLTWINFLGGVRLSCISCKIIHKSLILMIKARHVQWFAFETFKDFSPNFHQLCKRIKNVWKLFDLHKISFKIYWNQTETNRNLELIFF